LKTAWITGCYGFVGPYLARELLSRNVVVFGIDRAGSSAPAGLGVRHLEVNLLDVRQVAQKLRDTRPDAIFHLAAQSSAALSFQQPGETLDQNIQTTVGLLEGIRQSYEAGNAPRLLSVGSCEEYGPILDETHLPVREDQALRPASPYAVSKAAQTLLCLQYHDAYGLPIVCTRSFTHTGPGQHERFVFSSFAKQIAEQENGEGDGGNGKGILEVGNLDAVRDVSDVRDITRAYVDLLEKAAGGELVNICSGRGLRIGEGLAILTELSRLQIEVRIDPERFRPLDVPVFIGDSSRLEKLVGWKPSIPPEKTLADLLNHWRRTLPARSRLKD
jgi:GDP-4-dehydro-6-deoxy-D-mannose reductase